MTNSDSKHMLLGLPKLDDLPIIAGDPALTCGFWIRYRELPIKRERLCCWLYKWCLTKIGWLPRMPTFDPSWHGLMHVLSLRRPRGWHFKVE